MRLCVLMMALESGGGAIELSVPFLALLSRLERYRPLWWCCWVKSCLDVAVEQFWALKTFVVPLLSWIVPLCRCRADLSAIDLFGGATELNVILALGNFFWFWKILWKLFSHAILFVCSFFVFSDFMRSKTCVLSFEYIFSECKLNSLI